MNLERRKTKVERRFMFRSESFGGVLRFPAHADNLLVILAKCNSKRRTSYFVHNCDVLNGLISGSNDGIILGLVITELFACRVSQIRV